MHIKCSHCYTGWFLKGTGKTCEFEFLSLINKIFIKIWMKELILQTLIYFECLCIKSIVFVLILKFNMQSSIMKFSNNLSLQLLMRTYQS